MRIFSDIYASLFPAQELQLNSAPHLFIRLDFLLVLCVSLLPDKIQHVLRREGDVLEQFGLVFDDLLYRVVEPKEVLYVLLGLLGPKRVFLFLFLYRLILGLLVLWLVVEDVLRL